MVIKSCNVVGNPKTISWLGKRKTIHYSLDVIGNPKTISRLGKSKTIHFTRASTRRKCPYRLSMCLMLQFKMVRWFGLQYMKR